MIKNYLKYLFDFKMKWLLLLNKGQLLSILQSKWKIAAEIRRLNFSCIEGNKIVIIVIIERNFVSFDKVLSFKEFYNEDSHKFTFFKKSWIYVKIQTKSNKKNIRVIL